MSDRYELREQIGEGGLGTVHRAHDRNLDREVAIKRVSTAALRQGDGSADMAVSLLKEARTLSALMHPNIVTVFDAGEDPDGPYVVMELLKGETLEDTVKRGALPLEDFERLVQQSLEGVIAAHAVNLVHRDLKPANLMVIWLPSGKFQIKILDFGLAHFSQQPSIDTSTNPSMLGSIYFMAPEQFENKPVDATADLYALGAIFYFALTGRYPFEGDTAPQVMASHLQHSYAPLAQLRPDLPAWLPEWIDWLISRQPDDRPATAVAALEVFQQNGRGLPGQQSAAAPKRMMRAGQSAPGSTAGPLVNPQTAQSSPAPKKMMRAAGAAAPAGADAAQSAASKPKMMKKMGAAQSAEAPLVTPIPSPQGQAAEEFVTVTAYEGVADIVPVTPVTAAVAPSEDLILTEEEERAMSSAHISGVVRHIPRWAFVTVPLLLIVGLGLGSIFLLKHTRQREAHIRFVELTQQDPPKGTLEDFRLIANYLDDPDHSGLAARMLWRFESESSVAIDQETLRQLQRTRTDTARNNLIRIAGLRGIPEATPVLMSLTRDQNAATRRSAWRALANTATIDEVPQLVERIDQISDTEREHAEETIIILAQSMPDETARVNLLMIAVRAAEKPETKKSMYRILSRLGGERAWAELMQTLKTGPIELRRDTADALSGWPTHDPVPHLLELLENETDRTLRQITSRSAAMLATYPGSYSQEQLFEMYKKSLEFTSDPRETNFTYTGIANLVCPPALEFFQNMAETDPLRSNQSIYVGQIRGNLAKVVQLLAGDSFEVPLGQLHFMTEGPRVMAGTTLMNWTYVDDWVALYLYVPEPASPRLIMEQSSDTKEAGSLFLVADGNPRQIETIGTGSVEEFVELDLGRIDFKTPGHYRIWFQPHEIPGDEFLRVRGLRLEKN